MKDVLDIYWDGESEQNRENKDLHDVESSKDFADTEREQNAHD